MGPHVDGYANALKAKGYCHHLGRTKLGIACQFNVFLMDRGITTLADVPLPAGRHRILSSESHGVLWTTPPTTEKIRWHSK